jgi:deoxyadenosine/deoxycytidine kinase
MYVAVAGTIGAGKSTLTRLLADRYHLRPVFEAVDENPYLADFYADMRRWAFHSQMFFLATRLEQHLAQVNPASASSRTAPSTRTPTCSPGPCSRTA